ncbi:7166_t:CDS:10 [Ambispora leptoticha]|uniref:7166_t:CDS:1 n=1 Tax=Ambispora leptoticha TaxID=144679 RepID=A0A9N9G3B3_9GLOM|nr:7166_t:CDS:10 [Ambispora leptoticha]
MESHREKITLILQKATILVGQTKDKNNDTTTNGSSMPETLAKRLERCKEKIRAQTTVTTMKDREINLNLSDENTSVKEEHQQYMNKNTDQDVNKKLLKIQYVELCLETLIELNDVFREKTAQNSQQQKKQSTSDVSDELLGVRDLRLIHTMLEIVVSWGIYPCLMPGVGIPLSQRSISGFTQTEILNDLNKDESDNSKSLDDPRAQYVKLFNLLESLTSIIFSCNNNELSYNYTSISQILLTRHLIDMYAALLQLAYGPMPKIGDVAAETRDPKNITNRKQISAQVSSFSVSEQDEDVESSLSASSRKVVNFEKARQESFAMFSRVFERADVYRSLESLMILLGASPLHPAPNWLKGICGRLLTHILLKPDGVKKVIDFMIGGENEVNFSKQENIARVLLSVPSQMTSVEDYFSKICPQLLDILASTRKSTSSDNDINAKDEISVTATVAAFTIIRMNAKYPALTKKLVINKLFEKLSKWWGITPEREQSNSTILSDASVQDSSIISDLTLDDPMVMDETSLQSTIRVVHRILVGSEPIPDLLQSFLEDAIAPLYHLYAFTVVSKSNLREAVLDILLSYFRIVTNSDGLEALKEIVFRKSKRYAIQPPEIGDVNEVYFAPGPLGGSVMRLRLKKQHLSPTTTNLDVDLFIAFLKSLSNNDLTGDFFMYLLNEYTAAKADYLQTANSKRVLTLLHLVLGMIDSLGSDILRKPGQVIAFVNNVLENYHSRVDNEDARKKKKQHGNSIELSSLANIVDDEENSNVELPEDQQDEDETLTLALTLLTSLLAEHKSLSTQDTHILNLVFENLSRFGNHQSPDVRQMTRELRLAVSVRNAARTSSSSSSPINEKMRKREESVQKYKEAMEALQDEILPVRARGLVILKEMILAKDPFINEDDNLSKVLDIFIQMIQDEESFIYLNAVRGLSSLAEVHGQTIMQKLMKWYDNPNENIDNRLRVGEAILQTIQRCGKALGKYITTLLPPLLHVLDKDQNEQLRVSSLSIIGTACQTSPYALSFWFDDLVGWILNILDFEKMIEVRRASVVLLISLFRGLAVDTIQQIYGDLLKRAYISLRYIENTDTDDLTRYHARVCLSDLDVIVKDFLTSGSDNDDTPDPARNSILYIGNK